MRRLTVVIAALVLAACAQESFPPGGPERHVPPKLLLASPESGAVNVKADQVVLKFDEVVSEKPAGTAQQLDQIVLVSPSDGKPDVGWHRSSISIKGHRKWRPNTAYVVTLLPALADLHGNVLKSPITVVFSTGATIPDTRVTGVVFDWSTDKPLAQASIEAIQRPDSIVYLARADSSGRFTLPFAPAATYTVIAWNDANTNGLPDPREALDSTRVSLRDSVHVELYTFVHDSIAPRIMEVSLVDSAAIRATFDKPLDTALAIDTSLFTLKRGDSTVVPLARVEPASVYDSIQATKTPRDTSRAHLDSLRRAGITTPAAVPPRGAPRGAADTTKRLPPPKPSRPSPVTAVVIITASPLQTGTAYRLEAHGLRNLLGYKADAVRLFNVPKPQPPAKGANGKGAQEPANAQPPPPAHAAPVPAPTKPDTVKPDTTRRDSTAHGRGP